MKILWLINIVLPQVARRKNEKVNSAGGWLISLSHEIPKSNQLVVCYPYNEDTDDEIEGVSYYGFKGKDDSPIVDLMIRRFKNILENEKPDVIHIWGTEHLQSYAMMAAATQLKLKNRVVVSIQGMVLYYAKHFMANIPNRIQLVPSFRDVIRQDSLLQQKECMVWKGEYEKRTIEEVHHIIGRTTWDKICTEIINPEAIYHFNNEILRNIFYTQTWNIENCEKYSVFVSQAQTPIKGFHFVLEAANLLRKKYPQLRIYVAGSKNPFNNGINATAYSKYLYEYAKRSGLLEIVTYVGNLDENNMCDRFLKSHVFVSASSIENSPNSVGEAMLVGMPIVASNVGGTSDLLLDKQEGYLYQFDAPYMMAGYIDRIFQDDSMAVKMGKQARAHALKTHDKDKNFEELIGIYRQVYMQME